MIQELGVGLCVPTLDPGGSRSPRASDSGNWQASRPDRRSEGQSCEQPRGGGSCPREKAAGVLPPSFSPRCVCAATSRPVQRRERDGCRHRIPRGAPLCSFLWEPFSAVRRPHLFRAGPEGVPPPPPAPVGDKVSASPGSGRMQRAHASLQASVISPARHGRFCSSAAPKPRNLVRKEMVCLTPASNGEDKSDHLLQGDCDIPPCGGVDTDLKRTARWTSTQTRWPLWDQGEPARPQEAPAFSSEGPGPWTGWHSGLGAPHRHWRGLGPVKIHPGSQFSRRRHHEGAPDLIVPV